MNLPLPHYLAFFSAVAVAGAIAGVLITGVPEVARKVVPLSGLILLLVAVLWVMPELGDMFGWPLGPLLMLAAFGVVLLVDRYVHPVCPTCAHTHDHDACSTRLHGFATPLIAAAIVHSLFDGWALVAGETAGANALSAGIIIHKIPECLAYGVILRAALRSRRAALAWAGLAQVATPVGAIGASVAAPHLGSGWVGVLLAVGGGTFLYLGFHAVHGEWKRRTADRPVRAG